MTNSPQVCPNCQHPQHLPGTECETPVNHGPNRWHLCLCLARPGAALPCPPQMACQGGTLGYADIWYLQQGHSLSSADGVISPEVLKTGVASVGFPSAADGAPVCKFEQGCHRVVACDPGCAVDLARMNAQLAAAEEAGPDDVLADAVALLREAATLYDAREQPQSAALLRRMAAELNTPSGPAAVPAAVEEQPDTEAPPVCQGFVWIGQSFATCDRCAQPAWDHAGEEVAVEGAGPFDTRRTVRPWKPGQADAIRAKWDPSAAVAQPGKEN